jgi:hypothetical protein
VTPFQKKEAIQNFVFKRPGAGNIEKETKELSSRSHHFKTGDEKSFISLATDVYAVSTKKMRSLVILFE